MKIYVIGKKNVLYWDNHVVDAFNQLGHEVKHFQINKRTFSLQLYRGLLKGILGKNRGNYISNNMIINQLKMEIESFKPNLIFFTSACFIPVEFYEVVNSLTYKPKIFAWEGDGGSNSIDNRYLSSYIDIMFEMDKLYVDENKLNFNSIVHLPLASNLSLYKDFGFHRENRTYFCGNLTKDRDDFFSELIDFDLVLKGWNWDKLTKRSDKFDITLGTIDIKEQINDYNKYKSVINKHQEGKLITALNMRVFEVPSCKTLLINDYREGIEEYFDIEKEIVVYRNMSELFTILEKLKNHPNEFNSVIENGFKRVQSEHTYIHRMQKVLEYV